VSEHTPSDGPSAEELRNMTPEEVMLAGSEADGVHIIHRRDRFPVRGTRAEKRAERAVALAFAISGLSGVAFVVCFIALPFHWHLPGTPQNFRFYTPVLGALLAAMLLFMGLGMVLWAKWLMPEEEVVQDRHQEPSTEEDKMMTESTLIVGLEDTGLPRRSLILRSMGLAGGAIAAVPLVALVGAMIKKPGKQLDSTMYAPNPMFPNGVPLVDQNFNRISPNDMLPGGIQTVFPGIRQEDADGYNGVTSASSPTLLIRLKPGQTIKARPFNTSRFAKYYKSGTLNTSGQWGDFVAFSKICTHAGCPASLYEQQTSRLLCPCHQSQFQVLEDAKPVFGPASRSLPKLPLGIEIVNGQQYFVAKGDFPEPIGPGFWERS
jgi:ubiquinol-cytochrome c reductase iron-sulfur subunit